MLSFKNWVALGFVVFGSTFLWVTRDFLADRRAGTGVVWSVVQVLALLAIVAFAVAGWVVFRGGSWWEGAALASAIVGVAALVPYVIGIVRIGSQGDGGVLMNIAIHLLGLAVVFAVVLIPVVHEWVSRRI